MTAKPPTITTPTAAPDDPPRLLLTPRRAAEALSVCEKTLYNLTRRGELPAVKIGRAVRYALSDLQAFIDGRKGGA